MATDVEQRFLKKSALDDIASDPAAMSSVAWDRIHEEERPDGSVQRYGIDDETSARYPLDLVEPQVQDADAPGAKPKGPQISQVIENGVSYDIETREDGSEWLRGRTGEISGVGVQLKAAGTSTPEKAGLGTDGQRTAGKQPSKASAAPISTMIKRLDPGEGVDNADGTQSSERSITVTDPLLNDGRPTNIPTIWKIGSPMGCLLVGGGVSDCPRPA